MCLPKVGDKCVAELVSQGQFLFGIINKIEGDLAFASIGEELGFEDFCGDLPTRQVDGFWVFESF